MSWASNNVEAYQEIEIRAVTRKLTEALKANGFDWCDDETVNAVVETLAEETSDPSAVKGAWNWLTTWAHKEIVEGEIDYIIAR